MQAGEEIVLTNAVTWRETNIFSYLSKYILVLGQIHSCIRKKPILQFGKYLLRERKKTCAREEGDTADEYCHLGETTSFI